MSRKEHVVGMLLLLAAAFAVNAAPKWQLIQPKYPIADVLISAYSITDLGATGDGVTDQTALLQRLIDSLGNLGGGTVFLPEGKYVVRGSLIIRRGVTLRGEWSKPVKGQTISGTIIMAYAGRGNESASPLFTMETSSAVRDLSIWYPEQVPASITAYPPSIMFGETGYFGNEFCNAKNITFVNSYSGLVYSRTNGGTCPVINGLYGTPLSRGVEIDNIADVGRIENIDFSPAYWEGSGLANAPAPGSAMETWIYQNGTGIVMRRNDWSYVCNVSVEGYWEGEHVAPSIASPGAIANGHQYAMTFTKCKTAIYFEVVSGYGIMFSRVTTSGCDSGFVVGPNQSGGVQFLNCTIDANVNAVAVNSSSSSRVLMQKCTFARGAVSISGGVFTASDCDFNNAAPQVTLGTNSRGIITGDRFLNPANIQNKSQWTCAIDQTPMVVDTLPPLTINSQPVHQPPRMVMYNAVSQFGAKNDNATDNTSAIQSALNQASSDGGGIVFLPPGKYRVNGNLTIPTGVELTGAADISTAPSGAGSILETTAGRGNASAAPFIKVSTGGGLRGLTFDYPDQNTTQLPNIGVYPYLIQVTGANVYIINVGMRMTYNGIDLFTYKCDNHYIDFVTGHVFKNAIRVGGNSVGGEIRNLQYNISYVSAGSEAKWGSWPNSPESGGGGAFSYADANLYFMILGACQNETLYDDFGYGSQIGLQLLAENGTGPTGVSLGLGIDGSTRSISMQATGTGGYDFINSQFVSLGGSSNCHYVETPQGSTAQCTFFSSDYWGQPGTSVSMGGGTLNFQLAYFSQQGTQGFATVSAGALNIDNSAIFTTGTLLNSGAESKLSAQSSIIDPSGINKANCALWKNNIGNSAVKAAVAFGLKNRPSGEIGLIGAVRNPLTRCVKISYELPAVWRL